LSTVIIIGNATADAELTFTPSGAARLTFTVAENIRQNKNGKWTDVRTDFHRVTVWREKAEILVDHVRKGTPVVVIGETESRTVDKDGDKRTFWGVVVREVGIIPRAVSHDHGPRDATNSQTNSDPWGSPAAQNLNGGGWDEPASF